MRISIVIPNWNGLQLLKKHLKTVITNSKGAQIIVSDDHSTDGSVEYVKNNFPNVIVVERKVRGGFASNANSGVSAATGDIVVLLNTDVVPESGYLNSIETDFSDPNVFAVGFLEKSQENGKDIQRGRGIARWKKGFYIHARGSVDNTITAWVSGGSGAFRTSMWEKLGGMDTIYNPFYWEDIDLSYRARKAGWKTLFNKNSVVHHYHEEGKIKSEFTSDKVNRISYRNQFMFIWKNVSDLSIICKHFVWTPIRLFQSIMQGDYQMILGFIMALAKLPIVLERRLTTGIVRKKSDRSLDILM